MDETQTQLDPQVEAQLRHLRQQIRNAQQLQYNASEARRAAGVFAMERLLDRLYGEEDRLLGRR